MGLFDGLIGIDQGSAIPVTDPASIRYNNPGAMWPGPSAANFGSTGSVNLNDGQGNQIAVFSDPIAGAAAQFDLLSRKYAGKTIGDAIAQWSGGNSSGQYAANVARAVGLSPSDVITPQFLASPQGITFAQAMAKHEAGRDYPLSIDQWAQAQSRAFSGAKMPIDTTAAPAPLGAPDPSQLVLPSERYRNLAQAMTQAGLTRPVHGLGDALLGFSNMLQGNAYGSQYEQQQRDYNKALGGMLAGAGDDQNKMRAVLTQSQSLPMMQAAAQMVLNKPQATYKQFGTELDGITPRIVKEYPDGRIEKVDLDALPPAVQTKIKAGEAVPGPANYPATQQGAIAPNGQTTAAAAASPPQPQQPRMSISAAMQAGLRGEDFLNVIRQHNPAIAQRIQAIANGDELPSRSSTGPDALKLIPLVYQYDPTFNRTNAEARYNYKKSFQDPNKKTGFQAIALNNFLHHGESLYDRIDLGPNHTYTPLNELSNFVNADYYKNNLAQNDKIADFLGPEAVKVASGAEGGEAERLASANSFKSSQGQDAIRGNLRGAATVAEGKLNSLLDNWKAIMGSRPIPPEILNPRAQEILQKLKTPPKSEAPKLASGPTKEDVEAEMRRRGLLQ